MQKILIAEDDVVLREAYVTILEYAGYTVLQAADGRQALERAEKELPELLILDMLMPGMTGMEVLRDERLRAIRNKIKIIAFTNLSDPETLAMLQELQVDRYLLKSSIRPQMLVENVKEVLAES